MNDKNTMTPQATERAGHTNWERVILGSDSLSGTVRLIVYVAAFTLIFGSIFHFTA